MRWIPLPATVDLKLLSWYVSAAETVDSAETGLTTPAFPTMKGGYEIGILY
jgi:hypothetical protein